jgi:hypothetical protein
MNEYSFIYQRNACDVKKKIRGAVFKKIILLIQMNKLDNPKTFPGENLKNSQRTAGIVE